MNKTRFEAFSDGVFAFAVTLLILGIVLPEFKNPPPTEVELTSALLRLWPNLLAYALSFAVIGRLWHGHHALFRLVDRVDHTTIYLTLVLLGVTAFIPFATSELGAYPHDASVDVSLRVNADEFRNRLQLAARASCAGRGVCLLRQ